jgi:hypothetical protein
MYFSKLAIAVVGLSMSIAAQSPQRPRYVVFCPSEMQTYRNPFPLSASVELTSTTLLSRRIDWTKLTPPTEFRPHNLTGLDTMKGSLPFTTPQYGCVLVHVDEKGRFHVGF